MQLSTFYNVLLQLFDTLMVMNAVFFDVFMVKEVPFLTFLCNDFSRQQYVFYSYKNQLLRVNPTLYNIKKTGMIRPYHSRLLCYLLLILDRLVAVRTVMCKQVFQI